MTSEDQEVKTENSHHDFVIRFNEPLCGTYQVHYITIPNSLQTIVIDINNGLSASEDDVVYVDFTLPPGTYTPSTLAAALKVELDTAFPGVRSPFVVAVDSENKLQLTTADGKEMYFSPDGNANRTLGLYETKTTTILSAGKFPSPLYLGDPLSIGIEIKEASDAGYVTAGGRYVSDTVTGLPNKIDNPVTGSKSTMNTDRLISTKQQATLIVPRVTSVGDFCYTTTDDFKQYIRLERGTKTLTIRTLYPVSGLPAILRAPWEMLIERVHPELPVTKKKRQRTV